MEGEEWLSAVLNTRHLSSSAVCIYRIPSKLRKGNEEALTPQAVSIGPFHHGKEHLQPMQPNKLVYVKCFFDRTAADKNRYYQMVKEWEEEARVCYQGDIHLNQDEFVKMLLVDGIFIVEYFLRLCLPERIEEDDDIFKKPLLREDIIHDIILLENQLPFFILKGLYNPSESNLNLNLPWEELLQRTIDNYLPWADISLVSEVLKTYDIRHLLHFWHALHVHTTPRVLPSVASREQKFELSRSATDLQEAGVKFVLAPSTSPSGLVFSSDGLFKISPMVLNRWTVAFFRNLIAYEHCLHKEKIHSSFIIMMGSLLKTPKDVDLFVDLKFIDNRSLGNSEDVCNLFKNLYSRSMMDNSEFYYTPLCHRLNKYSKDYWHQWKAARYRWEEMLKRDYFSNPWSIISSSAGFLLLILTIIQTVFSVIAGHK